MIAKWLGVEKGHIKKLLISNFEENRDYIISKETDENNRKRVLLTHDCGKILCMISRSNRANLIRKYYIELEKLIIK